MMLKTAILLSVRFGRDSVAIAKRSTCVSATIMECTWAAVGVQAKKCGWELHIHTVR